MLILIAGPRVGKSTSLVIPAIAAAPGAVVTTSNKRDVVDATRDLRADAGRVWVFDPQEPAAPLLGRFITEGTARRHPGTSTTGQGRV